MKKLFTLLIIAVIFMGSSYQTNAQNLIENWDGNGATGAGSEANNFGWYGTPAVTFAQANVSGSIRYMDNPSGWTYNGTTYTGRGLCIRWDNVGSATTNTIFAYPVALEANKSYFFTGKIGWNSNGGNATATLIYVGINGAGDNSGTYLELDTVTIPSADKLKFHDDTIIFSPVESGNYYLTFRSTNNASPVSGSMGMVADLSITETTDPCIKDLNNQFNALSIPNATNIKNDITLPSGSGNVAINWKSSNTIFVSNTGVVTQPEKFGAQVKLYATLTSTCGGVLYTHHKELPITIQGKNPSPSELLAEWKFENTSLTYSGDTAAVKDVSGNNLVGKLKNDAVVRSIGTTTKYNVLDLGKNTGYFDMGNEIGMAIYSLTDYTIGTYFRIDSTYTELANNGNFLWTFSNSSNQASGTGNGYLAGRLNATRVEISTNNGSTGNQSVSTAATAPQGKWHHMVYVQQVDSGKIYIDGVLKAKGLITNKPQKALTNTTFTGTPFNWIGRSCFSGDVYLRNTLIYDFQLYNVPLTQGDLDPVFDYNTVITRLNTACDQKYVVDTLPELINEMKRISFADPVASNVTLPTRGTLDANIVIAWTSNLPSVISNSGVITKRDYIRTTAQLTAVLSKNGQTVTKVFTLHIAPNTGTEFTSDLILNYNFVASSVSGTTVTDAAEKHYAGSLRKGATAITIGPDDNRQPVLCLYSDTAYFDMGKNCGQLVYGLSDFSVSAYYLADFSKTNFGSAGNFLYTFSNSDSTGTAKNGYLFGRASGSRNAISSGNYDTEMTTTAVTSPGLGKFHHFVYTQQGFTGTVYIDGKVVATNTGFTKLPFLTLPVTGRTGTNFNFLGRSNFVGDVNLGKALISDFRLYQKALSNSDVTAMQDKLTKLDMAFIHDSIPTLLSEWNNLSIGDVNNVISDITLPAIGAVDSEVKINWTTSNPSIIAPTGIVTRPDYMDAKVTLTATLDKKGQSLTKVFTVTVKANAGSEFASDLLVNYDFLSSLVSGTQVTDAAEKHFQGTLKNGATVGTIGPEGNKFNVLQLNGTDTAYFDMGLECGRLMYLLNDYSVSAYFLIDVNKTNFSNSGNFLYCFSNSDNAATDKSGYLFGRATNSVHGVTSQYSGAGLMQTKAAASATTKGIFHLMVFTQKGKIGTTYFDGVAVATDTAFTNLPSNTLSKEGKTGTLFNWLGRSSVKGDAYLGNAFIADFRLYKKALTIDEVTALLPKRKNLDNAYHGLTPVEPVKVTDKISFSNATPGQIQIIGLTGKEKVNVTDLLGRMIPVKDPGNISLKPGIYIIRVDNHAAKVLVK